MDITADGLYENSPETFTIQLTTTADNVDIVQNATEIIVFDSDGKFESMCYSYVMPGHEVARFQLGS